MIHFLLCCFGTNAMIVFLKWKLYLSHYKLQFNKELESSLSNE